MQDRVRVVVVGGSIAGCAAAAALRDAGHRVSVHERLTGPLVGRGAGIATDHVTMARLVDHGLVDRDMPRVDADVARYVHRAATGPAEGCWIGDVDLPAAMFHWSDLHRSLRSRVPDADYREGDEVTATADGSDVRLAGFGETPDLIVFADGYRSAGRRLVAPGAAVAYDGLVIWRGLVAEREIDLGPLLGTRTRIVYPGGHGVAYLIPGPDGASGPGERQAMWAFYLPVPESELAGVLTDRDGRRHGGSVELGRTAPAVDAALRARLAPVLPDYFVDLVDHSRSRSLQAVSSVTVDRSHRGRSCLVGDAATVFPPFTASGVLKAVDDALTLRAHLDSAPSVETALAGWGQDQELAAARIRPLAERNHRELVTDVPDLAAMSTAEKSGWLAALHPGGDLRLP